MRAAEEPLEAALDVKGLRTQVLGRIEVLEAQEFVRVIHGSDFAADPFGGYYIVATCTPNHPEIRASSGRCL